MMNRKSQLAALAILVLAIVTRIGLAELHIYNFAPMVALGLFSTAVFKDVRMGFGVAIIGQFIADMYFEMFTNIPGFYGLPQVVNYVALLVTASLGKWASNLKVINIAATSLAGTLIFFLMSNFGVWLDGYYGYSFNGLMTSYAMGLPFLKNAFIGDAIASTLLFGAFILSSKALKTIVKTA